jgi:hypothetical protein
MGRGMELDHDSSLKINGTLIMNSPSGRKNHGGKGETMSKGLHPNEVILTKGTMPAALLDALTLPQVKALLEQYERQNGEPYNAASS